MSVLDYYNRNARSFIEGTVNADMSRHYARFLRHIPSEAVILDLGCGSGRDTAFFRKMGYTVIPVDGSREICRLAEAFLHSPVRCVTFNALDYCEAFDAVWACASLLHVRKAEMESVMKLVSRGLKANGVLYASFKYGDDEIIKNGRFFNNYSENTIGEAISSRLWTMREIWKTGDVRSGRGNEQWLNIIVSKNNGVQECC